MKKRIGTALLGKPHDNSISIVGTAWEKSLGWLVLVCFFLWGAGAVVPMVRTEKLFILVQDYSILTTLTTLYDNREWLLLVLVGLFGVANPVFKLDQMYRAWRRLDVHGEEINKTLKRIDLISKWSMGDVFVVAVLVVVMKTSGVMADAHVKPGVYLFAASSIGSMIVAFFLKQSVEHHQVTIRSTFPEAKQEDD